MMSLTSHAPMAQLPFRGKHNTAHRARTHARTHPRTHARTLDAAVTESWRLKADE